MSEVPLSALKQVADGVIDGVVVVPGRLAENIVFFFFFFMTLKPRVE